MNEIAIAGIFTIVGGAIGAVATYLSSVILFQRQRLENASVKFREIVIDETIKAKIYSANEILASFETMIKAAYKFSFYVDDYESFMCRVEEIQSYLKTKEIEFVTMQFYEHDDKDYDTFREKLLKDFQANANFLLWYAKRKKYIKA